MYSNLKDKRDYQKAWVAERRQNWIDSRGGKCEECGSTERLEVDHIDPSTKEINVNKLWSRRAEIRLAELEKCQVLCYLCHRDKTVIEQQAEHGTQSRYTSPKWKCRCERCKSAHNKTTTNWKRDRVVR